MKIEININNVWTEIEDHDSITDKFGTQMIRYMNIYRIESLGIRDWYIKNNDDFNYYIPHYGVRITV